MQYDPGSGDYSRERHELFADVTLDEVLAAIEQRPSKDSTSRGI